MQDILRSFMNISESYSDTSHTEEATVIDPEANIFADLPQEDKDLRKIYKVSNANVKQAIRLYTKTSELNSMLRAGKPLIKDYQKQFDLLMSLKGTKLLSKHHVYSGTGTFDPLIDLEDKTYFTNSFLSSSLDIKIAAKNSSFHREDHEAKEDHIVHLILNKGFDGGFYVAPYSYSPEELEFLIFPEEEFTYISSEVVQIESIKRHIHSFESSKK